MNLFKLSNLETSKYVFSGDNATGLKRKKPLSSLQDSVKSLNVTP